MITISITNFVIVILVTALISGGATAMAIMKD